MSDDITPIRSNGLTSERLAEIDRITDASEKVKALVELASQLLPSPSELLAEALKAQPIRLKITDVIALELIAPQLPQNEPQLGNRH